jgi:choline dehydrogenase-like flavoprotein
VQEAVQVVGQGGGGGIAAARLLAHRLQADVLQVTRQLGIESPRPARLFFQHLQQQQPALAREGADAGEHLVEHDAEAVDVGAGIDAAAVAPGLLRAHVRRRAEYLAGLRQRGVASHVAGQAEVGELGNRRQGTGVRGLEKPRRRLVFPDS